VTLCSDGIDNNLNGLIDCADPGCQNNSPCIRPVPLASPLLLVLILASLSLFALLSLRRRLH
jgi:hypothetical protein